MDNQQNTIALDQVYQEEIQFDRPSLLVRIKSMLADSLVIIGLMIIASLVLNALQVESGIIRGVTFFLILLYEPIMVAVNRTVGQKIMGIRIRNYTKFIDEDRKRNINIFSSLFRFLVKFLLGWISLLTIHSNKYGQAIHDIVGNSIMTFE